MVYREDGTFPSYITDLHLRGKARKNKDQISILVFTCLVFFLGGCAHNMLGAWMRDLPQTSYIAKDDGKLLMLLPLPPGALRLQECATVFDFQSQAGLCTI